MWELAVLVFKDSDLRVVIIWSPLVGGTNMQPGCWFPALPSVLFYKMPAEAATIF